MHTKRTGHTEFTDKTAYTVKPIALEVAKNNDVDMVDASTAGEPEGILLNLALELRYWNLLIT